MECKVLVLWLDFAGIVLGLAAAVVLLLPPWQDMGDRRKTGRLKYLRDQFTWRRGAKQIAAAIDQAEQALLAFRPRDRIAIMSGLYLLLVGFAVSAMSKIIPLLIVPACR